MNTLKSKNNETNFAKLAVSKSLLKEYRTSDCARTVYLNDGDEFQIQLFNPETTEIGAEILIDNEPLSNIIILHPGERMWLERYTDKAKKFKFTVYTVDGSSSVVEKAIAHNGEVVVKFYRKQKPIEINHYHYPSTIHRDIWVNPTPWWDNNIIYCNTSISSDVNSITNLSAENTCMYSSSITTGDVAEFSTPTASANISASASSAKSLNKSRSRSLSIEPEQVGFSCGEKTQADGSTISWASIDTSINHDLIETGRVAEGSHSNQRFTTVDIDLEYLPFRTETFKILPFSRKPYTSKDAAKLYCSSCGRKLNNKFKYCPYCGAEI